MSGRVRKKRQLSLRVFAASSKKPEGEHAGKKKATSLTKRIAKVPLKQPKREEKKEEKKKKQVEIPRVDRAGLIGWEELSDKQVLLRRFDLESMFGPCLGLTRRQRWERARKAGLEPPEYVLALLDEADAQQDSSWEGHAAM